MMQTTMKKAALMSRVSSDEQAKGHSLDVQEETLTKYCDRNQIEIVYKFREDHSAKNFKRPAFNEFLKYIRANRGKIDSLLITTWDRFSRNHFDSLGMIMKLKHYGITTIAIEQPLDLSVPENKLLHSMYLVLPEIENDRRSIKIRGGVRAALKSGRWARVAPVGYRNTRDEKNKPIIVPSDTATHIRYMFAECAKGISQAFVREELKNKGLGISRSAMSEMLRNPLYAGLIRIPSEGDEPEALIKGIHQGIISEELFYRTQSILNGNKKSKNKPNANRKRDELPLRGNLLCPNCSKNMTGSASKSNTGQKHFYYHCNYCHSVRFRADKANEILIETFGALRFDHSIESLFHAIVKEKVQAISKVPKESPDSIRKKIEALKKKIETVQDLLLEKSITSEDFRSMRSRIETDIGKLEMKKDEDANKNADLKKNIASCLNAIRNIGQLYENANLDNKQKIISSIFPGKIIFDGKKCRTPRLNEMISLIISADKGLDKIKTGQHKLNPMLSGLVENTGVEPVTSCMPCKRSSQMS